MTAFRILNGLSSHVSSKSSQMPLNGALTESIWNAGMLEKLAGHERSLHHAEQDVITLSYNDYFSRAWIYQEISCAKNVVVMCGSDCCSFSDLDLLFGRSGRFSTEQLPTAHTPNANIDLWRLLLGLAYCWNSSPDVLPRHAAQILESTLAVMRSRTCRDPRDRIFASLNLPQMRQLGPMLNLPVDYALETFELFVLFLSRFDQCVETSGERWIDEHLSDVVDNLGHALNVDPVSEAFCSWLQTRLRISETDNLHCIELHDGRKIDCSGRTCWWLLPPDVIDGISPPFPPMTKSWFPEGISEYDLEGEFEDNFRRQLAKPS